MWAPVAGATAKTASAAESDTSSIPAVSERAVENGPSPAPMSTPAPTGRVVPPASVEGLFAPSPASSAGLPAIGRTKMTPDLRSRSPSDGAAVRTVPVSPEDVGMMEVLAAPEAVMVPLPEFTTSLPEALT